MIFMVVHVDDFAIAASEKGLIDEFYAVLGKRYEFTRAESLESYLGIHIDYLSDGDSAWQDRRIDQYSESGLV
jgi:hypothetical protein